jgi:hypothetical protein
MRERRVVDRLLFAYLLAAALWPAAVCSAQLAVTVDLASVSTSSGILRRVFGSEGDGSRGVPVAGGFDCDDDGIVDYAFASMLASPLGRAGAGITYLTFGTGSLSGMLDTAGTHADVLKIAGDVNNETCGSELWMDDVTGDGLGDLLIARQNFTPDAGRIGAGALTILVGGEELRTYAATLQFLDLRSPPMGLVLTTFVGPTSSDRLGIWMRTGDVTGDGIADIVVGADQEPASGDTHSGAVYVVRGGPHLATTQSIDLASFGSTALAGHIAKIVPPVNSFHHHFGATCQIADLDGNGHAEVLVAAALNRAGATIQPAGGSGSDGFGGSADGTLYIAWDDNFTGNPWAAGLSFSMSSPPGSRTILRGGVQNISFGEEILGGLDYDDDGNADLFVGDIIGDGTVPQTRPNSGTGHVIYNAASLKGVNTDLDSYAGTVTTILGAASNDIAADTAMHGDFDGDGIADLGVSSPEANPLGRLDAGTIHVLFGQTGVWPSTIDLAALPAMGVRSAVVYGANGNSGSDAGDVLSYSAAAGDLNGDGRVDIITNEMQGDGVLPAAEDVGNLLLISGRVLAGETVGGRIRYYGSDLPVAGVTVNLQGAPNHSTTTDQYGSFSFTQSVGGNRQLVPVKTGDLNGAISSLDAALTLQAVVGLRTFDSMEKAACDVTANGALSSLDAAHILQKRVGLLEDFNVANLCGGDWVFFPDPRPVSNQTPVDPLISSGVCQPGAIEYTPLGGPVHDQDFIAVLFGDCSANWAPNGK